jgi:hypothetical protein
MNPAAIPLFLELLSGPPAAGRQPSAAAAVPSPVEDVVEYPLGPMAIPDFSLPAEPFKLVDLRYRVSDTEHTTHAFAARVKVRHWGYLGASFEGERREIAWTSQRLELQASGEEGVYGFSGSFRAPRFILSAAAQTGGTAEESGWLLTPSLTVRLSRGLEVYGWALGNTREPDDRFLRAASLGFLWQRGVAFEAAGEIGRTYQVVEAGFENEHDWGVLSAVGQAGGVEIAGEAWVEDVDGRFPRREEGGSAQARVRLAARLLAEGGARVHFEDAAGLRAHEYRGALTWFGRRLTLPRSGEAAPQSQHLARSATARGGNERIAFTDRDRRAQRERLSLSRDAEDLREAVAALHLAQVAERNVPLLGLEILDGADDLPGVATREARAFVGVPWPPSWPWQANEAAVPFLRLDVSWRRQTSGFDFRADTWASALSVALNREMDLVLRWSRSDPTALDLIRGVGQRRTIELAYVYAFGR